MYIFQGRPFFRSYLPRNGFRMEHLCLGYTNTGCCSCLHNCRYRNNRNSREIADSRTAGIFIRDTACFHRDSLTCELQFIWTQWKHAASRMKMHAWRTKVSKLLRLLAIRIHVITLNSRLTYPPVYSRITPAKIQQTSNVRSFYYMHWKLCLCLNWGLMHPPPLTYSQVQHLKQLGKRIWITVTIKSLTILRPISFDTATCRDFCPSLMGQQQLHF